MNDKEKIKILVDAMKKSKLHLDDCEGGMAWEVLDEALIEVGENDE